METAADKHSNGYRHSVSSFPLSILTLAFPIDSSRLLWSLSLMFSLRPPTLANGSFVSFLLELDHAIMSISFGG